jgi:hypothetical protein
VIATAGQRPRTAARPAVDSCGHSSSEPNGGGLPNFAGNAKAFMQRSGFGSGKLSFEVPMPVAGFGYSNREEDGVWFTITTFFASNRT